MAIFDFIQKAGQPVVEGLAAFFQSFPMIANYYTTVARWVFVVLAIYILLKSIRSLLAAKNPGEIWAYLRLPDNSISALTHWENVIGRAKSADVHINLATVSRNQGTLVRDENSNWYYNDLGSKSGSSINGETVSSSTQLEYGDTLTVGGTDCVLLPPSLEERQRNYQVRKRRTKPFSPWPSLIALTIFQILTCIQFIAAKGSKLSFSVILAFGIFTAIMWVYCVFLRSLRRTAFEMEMIAFFLCTLNLAVVATSAPNSIMKQLIAIIIGIALFFILGWYLRDLDRALKIRRLLLVISVGLLAINLIFGSSKYGAVNWVSIAGYNLQPSELVKIAFIFIGSATLDELYKKENLTMFMGFSVFCLGCLAIMNDFGTAGIFFITFLVISFLRSGEFSKLVLVLGVCSIAGLLAIRFVPHIGNRFATWMHAWDFPDKGGFQQVRAMSGGASGGLVGVGAGKGWVHDLFAADTDLVFSILAEEWGYLIALLAIFSLITLGIFAVRSITAGRSAFYTIAACSATSLIIFQTSLNVLGSLDILPFTGVTLPFISNGGTSMMASWGLLAFLKAADTRQNASFAVRGSDGAPDNLDEGELTALLEKAFDKGSKDEIEPPQGGSRSFRSRSSRNNKFRSWIFPKRRGGGR